MSETLAPETTAPADTAPPPAAPAVLGGDTPPASGVPEWRAALPPELRDAPSITKFNDPVALARSYTELESLIGRKGLVVPKEGDPPAVHAAYRQALGIPEKPDGYEIKVEGAPEAVWNAETGKVLASWAHELGLTPAQAQGLAERYAKMGGDGVGAQEAERARRIEEGAAALRSEWGAAFDAKRDYAMRAVREFGGDALLAELQALGAVSSPAIVKAFAAIGERMGEDRPAGMGTGRSGVMTPAEAKAEQARLMAPGTPYWDRRHPEHEISVRRWQELERMRLAAAS